MTGMALRGRGAASRRSARIRFERRGLRSWRIATLAFLSLAPVLGGCSHDSAAPIGSVAADDRAEQRREQDCANPQWKAANPGLYYNLCPDNPFQ